MPPGDYSLTSGCHGGIMPAIFFAYGLLPTGETGKNADTAFMRCSPNCHYGKQLVAKDKMSIYGKFLKNLSF
jgi:hypothetical protein